MELRRIEDSNLGLQLLLTYGGSDGLEDLINMRLKEVYQVSRENVEYLKTKNDLENTKMYNNMVPFLGGNRLYIMEAYKNMGVSVLEGVLRNNTIGIYVVHFSDYKSFLEVSNKLSEKRGVESVSLRFLSKADLRYIYKIKVSEDKRIENDNLLEYLLTGYKHDIELLFKVFDELNQGKLVLKDRKGVQEYCGRRYNTPINFTMKLLKDLPETPRGKRGRYSAVLSDYMELKEKYSGKWVYNQVMKYIDGVLRYKQLRLSAISVNKYVIQSDNEDVAVLKQLQWHKEVVEEVPLGVVLNLQKQLMDSKVGKFEDDIKFISFLSSYMGSKI